ncbi:MAG: hypothetical protein JWM16_3524, partial [Verrucomicrobiales bacterium]|nr:hypothetical protein [Verrucomicrobiales bacterium]
LCGQEGKKYARKVLLFPLVVRRAGPWVDAEWDQASSPLLSPLLGKRHKGEGKRFLWMFNPGLRAGAALTLG